MSYAELGVFGSLRKVDRCGPVSMVQKLLPLWCAPGSYEAVDGGRGLTPEEVGEKIKRFFRYTPHLSTTFLYIHSRQLILIEFGHL